MKFNDLGKEQWDELKPYLDTFVLPVTGIGGSEEPWEMTRELEKLRDVLEWIEIPYRGRIVTLPAYHYAESAEAVDEACRKLKAGGSFKYGIAVTANERLDLSALTEADLAFVLSPDDPEAPRRVAAAVEQLWRQAGE
jgi:hypothetical protein